LKLEVLNILKTWREREREREREKEKEEKKRIFLYKYQSICKTFKIFDNKIIIYICIQNRELN